MLESATNNHGRGYRETDFRAILRSQEWWRLEGLSVCWGPHSWASGPGLGVAWSVNSEFSVLVLARQGLDEHVFKRRRDGAWLVVGSGQPSSMCFLNSQEAVKFWS